MAVGLFFCLSGFWVTEMWDCRYRQLKRPYLEFIQSRWWRLAPVYFFCTLTAAVFAASGWSGKSRDLLANPCWWLTQPLIVKSSIFGRLLPPTWSLDVEMQFYIVAPLVLVLLAKLRGSLALAVALMFMVWYWFLAAHSRADEAARVDIWLGVFMVGMLASRYKWHPKPVVAVTGIGVVGLLTLTALMVPPLRTSVFRRGSVDSVPTGPVAAAVSIGLILAAMPAVLWSVRIRSSRFDRFLGDWSYPLYLIHWLPRDWYYARVHAGHNMVVSLTANFVMSFVASAAVLVFVDRPFQRWRCRWVSAQEKRRSARSCLLQPVAGPI